MSEKNEEFRSLPREKKLDARARRTRARLGALPACPHAGEAPQQAQRPGSAKHAHVSRSAFYAHYSDKVDLLLTDMDEFLGSVATHLSRVGDSSERVAVVTEIFAHVTDTEHIRAALARSGRLGDFYDLARQHFARGIEQRLKELPRSHCLSPQERSALAHAMAGALNALLDWWLSRRKSVSPEEIDRRFHQLVWSGIPSSRSKHQFDLPPHSAKP